MDKRNLNALRKTFGGTEWAWLRQRLRDVFENEKELPARISCSKASTEQKRLIGEVQGKAKPTAVLFLSDLEDRFREAGLCESLREFVEILDGPLVPRAANLRREEAAWESIVGEQISVAVWKRISGGDFQKAEQLKAQWLLFMDRVCEFQGVPVQRAAAELFGDSHALDSDRALVRLIAAQKGLDATTPRDLWHKFGLLTDEVSSHALVWNLRFLADSNLSVALNHFPAAGQPCRILLRHLRESMIPELPDRRLYVCENPAVLEAAAEKKWPHSLLCVEGNPSLACMMLLESAARTGAEIHYHGDFDWGGIRIANRVRAVAPELFVPWRFNVEDYLSLHGGFPLTGPPAEAEWSSSLSRTMREHGRGFHEEQELGALLK